jgi:hypothetical protein
MQCRIKNAEATATTMKCVKDKDLFSLGYPYFIAIYHRYVAVTSDYGILLFDISS